MPRTPDTNKTIAEFPDIDGDLFRLNREGDLYSIRISDGDSPEDDYRGADLTPEQIDLLLAALIRERGVPEALLPQVEHDSHQPQQRNP